MAIFLSYARRDAIAVRNLLGDLERAKQEAWYDRDLEGGERWWDAILEQIRRCDLFVFVLSSDSIRSRACRTELAYAVALQRPILPVQVSDVQVDLAPDPIGITHIVDYRERTSESAIALVLAVAQARRAIDLPDPMPDSPAPCWGRHASRPPPDLRLCRCEQPGGVMGVAHMIGDDQGGRHAPPPMLGNDGFAGARGRGVRRRRRRWRH